MLFGVSQDGKVDDKLEQYLDSRKERDKCTLESTKIKAAKKIEASQTYSKEYYDRKHKSPLKYSEGDYVMIKNFENVSGVSSKLVPKFKEPYIIVKELRNNRYIVADIDGFQKTQKPYQGTWESDNMRPWIKKQDP